MLRISKLTDYAVVIVTHLYERANERLTATSIADATQLSNPTVKKVLRLLLVAGLVESEQGVAGGYTLSRDEKQITVSQVIEAIEGSFAITECSLENGGCDKQLQCRVSSHWQTINAIILKTLNNITI
jgi:FeS assembly SUF system regulator